MVPLGPVVVKTLVNATRITVWAHLVRADLRADWWPELRLDPRFGGIVAERWSEGEGEDLVGRDATGEVDVLVEGHALGFRWKDAGDSRQTAVLITLRSADEHTSITVSEMGFDALSDAADRAASSEEGWRMLLADLVAVSEASGNVIPDPPAFEPEAATEPEPESEPDVEAEQPDVGSADDTGVDDDNTVAIPVVDAGADEASTAEGSDGDAHSYEDTDSVEKTDTGEKTNTDEESERDFERVLRGE